MSVQHVEMADKRLTFPKAQLRGDPEGTVVRLEIIDEGSPRASSSESHGPSSSRVSTNEQRWSRRDGSLAARSIRTSWSDRSVGCDRRHADSPVHASSMPSTGDLVPSWFRSQATRCPSGTRVS